MLTVLT